MKKVDIAAAIESGTLLALDTGLGHPSPVKVLSAHPTEPGCWKVHRPGSDRVFNGYSRALLDPWDVYTVKRDAEEQERNRHRAARADYERRQAEFLARLTSAVSAASGQRWVSTYAGIRQDDGITHSNPPPPDLSVQVGTPGAILLCDLLSLLPDGRPMSTTPLTDLTPEDVAYVLEREGHSPDHIAILVDFSQPIYTDEDLEAIRRQLP